MKATVKTAQMGLAAGEVVEVVSRGVRATIVRGSREIGVTVPTCDLDFSGPIDGPPPEPGEFSDIGVPRAPVEPPAPEPHFSTAPSNLDEPEPETKPKKKAKKKAKDAGA